MDKMDELDEMISANEPAPEQVHQPYFEIGESTSTPPHKRFSVGGIKSPIMWLVGVTFLLVLVVALNIFAPKSNKITKEQYAIDKEAMLILVDKQCQDVAITLGVKTGVKGYIYSDKLPDKDPAQLPIITVFKQISNSGVATIGCTVNGEVSSYIVDDLFSKVNNEWKIVTTKVTLSDAGYLCKALNDNKVPKSFIDKCSDTEKGVSHAR